MNEILAQHFWILPRTTHGRKEKMCRFTALQKFNPLILHIITKEGDTSFDTILLNSMTVCYSEHELQ